MGGGEGGAEGGEGGGGDGLRAEEGLLLVDLQLVLALLELQVLLLPVQARTS